MLHGPEALAAMKQRAERVVRLGLTRSPKKVFDEVEQVTARMVRSGWTLRETCVEESMGNIHLLFERDVLFDGDVAPE
jgi:hypothetical protein